MTNVRFGIRTIALTTVAVAIFCMGYRLGYKRGDSNRIDTLHRLMQTATGNGEWMQLGGPASISGTKILTSDECFHHGNDDSENTSVPPRSIDLDPRSDPFSDHDPFRTGAADYDSGQRR